MKPFILTLSLKGQVVPVRRFHGDISVHQGRLLLTGSDAAHGQLLKIKQNQLYNSLHNYVTRTASEDKETAFIIMSHGQPLKIKQNQLETAFIIISHGQPLKIKQYQLETAFIIISHGQPLKIKQYQLETAFICHTDSL